MSSVRHVVRFAPFAAVAALVFSAGLVAGVERADAQVFGFFDPPKAARAAVRAERQRHAGRDARVGERRGGEAKEDSASAKGSGPPEPMVYAVVSLADQHIKVYGADSMIARSRVSTGQSGFRTPTGIFGILEKQREHVSNIYDGASMPFMQRLTWSGIALHQGIVPRYPASHGCVRLPAAFASRLWEMTRLGARVVVSSRDIEPEEIAHPRLPMARMVPADMLGLQATVGDGPEKSVQVATVGDDAIPQSARRYNPIEVAALKRVRAEAEVATALKTAEQGRPAARAAAEESNDAADAVRDLVGELADARAGNVAPEQIADLERRLAEARALDAARAPRALETALVVRDAERAAEAAREALSEARRRAAPLSVLVSVKEGLVIVKQKQKPVYEAPFTLRDPGQPLGTHLFVATAPVGDDGRLRWSSLTVSQTPPAPPPKGGEHAAPAVAPELPGASSAREALDRITFTPETEQKLAELIWVGGNIIVTDRGVSADFGANTDMVVAIP